MTHLVRSSISIGRLCAALGLLALPSIALAAPPVQREPPASVTADRVAVRFISPETGGANKPRFLTEREVAFFARLEAMIEQSPLDPTDYPERYVRAAVDRLVARSMLSSLMIQRGVEPPDLPKLSFEARAELEARVGGKEALAEAMRREGIDDEELIGFLRDEVRAMYYVDRAVTPILLVTEDSLREAHRSLIHPFRGGKFDEVRTSLRRWLIVERFRTTELEFLQGVRARIRVTTTLRTREGETGAPRESTP